MKTAYRYRIYPDEAQDILCRKTCGCVRLVYNLGLEQRTMVGHSMARPHLSAYDQSYELPELKELLPFLKEAPFHTLQQALADLDKAFKNFFEGRAGYPKFKKKGDRDSFRYPDPKQFKVENERIFLPKLGWVKWVKHREIFGTPKNATVSREGDWWFVSIQCELEVADPAVPAGKPVGIDLGVAKSIVTSDGEIIMLPKTTEKERRRTASLQSAINRRKKGSKNRAKAVRALGRYKAKLKRRRKDAAHKATTKIAKNHSVIVVEDLKVKNMTASAKGTVAEPGKNVRQKAGLNRAILDVAPGEIRVLLSYKTVKFGSTLVDVPAPHTSQRCSVCGYIHADNRVSQSLFVCGKCGHTENADVNAAKNIRDVGMVKLKSTGGLPGVVCGSNLVKGRKQKIHAARQGSSAL